MAFSELEDLLLELEADDSERPKSAAGTKVPGMVWCLSSSVVMALGAIYLKHGR
jgi:hypothetical protein